MSIRGARFPLAPVLYGIEQWIMMQKLKPSIGGMKPTKIVHVDRVQCTGYFGHTVIT